MDFYFIVISRYLSRINYVFILFHFIYILGSVMHIQEIVLWIIRLNDTFTRLCYLESCSYFAC